MKRILVLEHTNLHKATKLLPKQYSRCRNFWVVDLTYENDTGEVVELEILPNQSMVLGELFVHIKRQLELHVPDTVVNCGYKVYRLINRE